MFLCFGIITILLAFLRLLNEFPGRLHLASLGEVFLIESGSCVCSVSEHNCFLSAQIGVRKKK